MDKIIYLPESAKLQLESSDESVRNSLIHFREKPAKGFTCEAYLENKSLDSNVLEDGFYHPVRDSALDDVIESLEIVKPQVVRRKVKPRKNPEPKKYARVVPLSRAKYRCFQGMGGDSECWAKYDGKSIDVLLQHEFYYDESGVQPYFERQEKMLDKILKEAGGIIINREPVILPEDYDAFNSQLDVFGFSRYDSESKDGNIYKIFAHDDGERGWAIFTVKTGNEVNVWMEDHNDNILEAMLSEDFLEDMKFDVDLRYLDRHNFDFYSKQYRPRLKDFKSDFDVDYDGMILPKG